MPRSAASCTSRPGKKWHRGHSEERAAFFESVWNSPGFAKISANYDDLLFNREANADWCAFMAEKIRSIVKDPATAEKLIPNDHLYVGLRPPYVTGYYEMYNKPNVELVSLRETPIVKVTETGIETSDGLREFDIIIWATGFDFGTGAMLRMGIVGDGGLTLGDYWADGPVTYLGIMAHGFPNLFFPGGPHGAAGNNPRYGELQVSFTQDLIGHAREHGFAPHRGPQGSRAGLDGHDRAARGLLAVREAGPVLRRQHARQGEGVPAQPGRPAEAR